MRKMLIATGVLSIVVTILTIVGLSLIINQIVKNIDAINNQGTLKDKNAFVNWVGVILCIISGLVGTPLMVLGVLILIKRKPDETAAGLMLLTAIFAICGLSIISSVTAFLTLAKIDKENKEMPKEELS